jgi:hypothetical protein
MLAGRQTFEKGGICDMVNQFHFITFLHISFRTNFIINKGSSSKKLLKMGEDAVFLRLGEEKEKGK